MASSKRLPPLTRAEAEIMQVLWQRNAATVHELVDATARTVAYTTMLTLVRILEKKGYVPRGPDPTAGRGTYVNPNTGRGYHIDALHGPPKGPHVGVHRPRDMRDIMSPRDYPMGGP